MAGFGRGYRCPLNVGSFSAQIDVFDLTSSSTKPLAVCGFHLGQPSDVGDAKEEQLVLVLKAVTGSPTAGSGGTVAQTPRPVNPGDTASAAYAYGNTTKLTGGTSVELTRYSWNTRQDFPITWIPEMWQGIGLSTHLVLELVTTPARTITGLVGSIEFIEFG